MRLKKVIIDNFRIIDNCEIEFDSQFNLIIGNNGTGKTSILEGIRVGLGGFIAGFQEVTTTKFNKEDIRMISELTGDGSYDIKYMTPTKVHCTIVTNEDNDIDWERALTSYKSSRTTSPKNISNYAHELINNSNSILPILSYQSAGRMWSQKREKWQDVFKGSFSRSVGYTDCLATESNIKMLTNWCKRMDYVSYQQNKEIMEYEVVKKAVGKFISILEKKSLDSIISYDKRREELIYSTGEEIIPVRLLSTGYRSIIGMIADIAYRMAVLNPNLGIEIIEKTNGIILIDEIDMHIHPKWQWTIVDALIKTFPSVQFIATTHSPIIISSCKDKRIIRLFDKDDSTSKVEMGAMSEISPYGWQINDVLNKFMYVDEREPTLKDKLYKIEELTNKKFKKNINSVEDRELDILKSELYDRLPENDAAIELIELQSIENILRMRGK